MAVKKASDLADLMLNPEDNSADVKRTTGDLAKELDLFSDIETTHTKPKKSAAVSSAVSSVVSSAIFEAAAATAPVANEPKKAAKPATDSAPKKTAKPATDSTAKKTSAPTSETAPKKSSVPATETAPEKSSVPVAETAPKETAEPKTDESAKKEEPAPAVLPDGLQEEVVPGIDDIIEPHEPVEHIIHYTAEDKKRLLRDLGAEAEFEMPQDGKETIIKTGPMRFEQGESLVLHDREERVPVPKKTKPKRRKKYRDEEERKSLAGTLVLIAVVLVGIYGGIFYFVHSVNRQVYDGIIEIIDPKTLSQIVDINVPDPSVSSAEKSAYGLALNLVDSDSDGLSDHFELDRGFAPAVADTDGDKMPDGAEYLAGTDPRNPKSNGVTIDSERDYSFDGTIEEASFSVRGKWVIYETIFDNYPISLTNRPGVISGIYELVLPEGVASANISFDLSKMNLDKWGENSVPAIYSYNPDDGSFERKDSSDGGGTISAAVSSGVYFVAADDVISETSGLNIMFVIDNSGSMYSADLVDGSEENDLEFRRVDFAQNLIAAMGDSANFGVSKFTLNYKLLSGISDDDEAAVSALETIRTDSENWNGTEISQSIISAVPQFRDHRSDRNFIIVITDGLPTNYNRDNELKAIKTCQDNNISLITIGLGKKIDSQFLSEAAEDTGGVYYQAVNNSSFESITTKIGEFLSTDRNTKAPQMPESDGMESVAAVDVILLADSGYTANADRLVFTDVATTDDVNGSDLGLALINKYYYTGTLPLSAGSYTANDRTQVRGYNISDIEFFSDGKGSLSEYLMPSVSQYTKFAAVSDKWNFRAINNETLPLSAEALAAAPESLFAKIDLPYNYDGSSDAPEILKIITFNRNKPFKSYEKAVIDASKVTPPENEVYSAINYYNRFSQKSGVYMYSFGVNGKTAFDKLREELTLGRPSVIVADGKVYNASKLSRMRTDGNIFVIEAYDPGAKLSSPVYIYLQATKLLDGSGGFQYTASLSKSGGNVPLYIIVNSGE